MHFMVQTHLRFELFDPLQTSHSKGVGRLGAAPCGLDSAPYFALYSAATLTSSAFSTRTALYLNSGILPKGSSAGLVRMLAAAST